MLIDILKMPPVQGLPIDRRMTLCTDPMIPQGILDPILHWPSIPLTHNRLTIGSLIVDIPQNLFKAIHLSHDGRYVFETVFGMDNTVCICLYTKIITATDVTIAIALNAIRHCRTPSQQVLPLTHFLNHEDLAFTGNYSVDPFQGYTDIGMIVPPVFGPEALKRHLFRLQDIQGYGFPNGKLGWMYKPVFDHEPGIMRALIDGYFTSTPFHELKVYHPNISMRPDRWYQYQNVMHKEQVMRCDAILHHPAFDNVALKTLMMFPSKFSVTTLILHALDGLKGMWLTRDYQNPYQGLFHGSSIPQMHHNLVAELAYACAKRYCEYFSLDPEDFFRNPKDQSSITITKNIYDEVSISIHDIIHDKDLCFYTYLPALALTTAAVGWYR